ncbi:LysM peptidoglycan-binding domain-containing protein [Lactobacillus taiwanensis]|uniref:LysM peptidoglycan-binding domain-containing protein n=1 Tax=Lactobacillus taiwanensis TaxID=508451 RepID=UPI001AEC2963|nr:LysM domain-containing protein [Lactobacillus taiwanensis]QTQ39258.1 LysM peptidoglycan-binding domain-containing protein [Lactobacillus taiwanensis]
MKENKSQDNKEPKGPYKHFQRPTTSRSAMHHRHAELEPESKQAPKTPNESEQNSHGMHHSQLWAGLIIVAIILIALIPIVSSRLRSNSNTDLAEKSVKVSKTKSSKPHKHKSKKSKSSFSKKSKSKSSVKKEEHSSSSQSQDMTPAVTSQSQSSEVVQSSSQSYDNSASQTTAQDHTQQSTQNSSHTSQNNWQTSGSSSSEYQAPHSYTVQEGDSLSKIARENNTSVHHLEQLNGLESADSISIGQSLKLK